MTNEKCGRTGIQIKVFQLQIWEDGGNKCRDTRNSLVCEEEGKQRGLAGTEGPIHRGMRNKPPSLLPHLSGSLSSGTPTIP